MGRSAKAILFYGFCWTEETDSPWNIGFKYNQWDEKEEDWKERYASRSGVTPPAEVKPYPTKPYQKYFNAKLDLIDALPVGIDFHCDVDCRMPFVFVKNSRLSNYGGDMTEITSLEVKPEWEAQLREFCEFMGIDVKDMKPTWWMVSYWG